MTQGRRLDPDELSTVLQRKPELSSPPETAFALVVLEGPDQGARYVLDGGESARVLVGQSPACLVRLADREVSRRHAAFDWVDGRLRVTDLGSSNGTRVDHVAIGQALLEGGELVRLGATVLRVESLEEHDVASPPPATHFGRTVGASREMRQLYPLCARLAGVAVPVVIEGETGTGKEVLAESLHEQGPRAAGPFVVFDCTAVPPNLVESELFGHERGAFTGATSTRKGVFEQAEGGTLLIDEIGDLDLALQPKLLRALERSEIRRVGGDRWLRFDVRVIAATRRDLDQEVQARRFRDDLYHRLAVARLELPPLRARRGDVPLLALHFCQQLGGEPSSLPGPLLALWSELPWPGNLRELRNAVARQLALGDWRGGSLAGAPGPAEEASAEAPPPLADFVARALAERVPITVARKRLVEEFERAYIEHVLAEHGGNVLRAAAASGIARRYFQLLRAKGRR